MIAIDQQLATAWYTSYADLLAYACRNSRDPRDAEDVVQEAFIRCQMALQRGVIIESIRSWLFTAVRYLLIDRAKVNRRRSDRRQECELSLAIVWAIPDPHIGPDVTVHRQQQVRRLRQAVQALTPLQRACLERRAKGLLLRDIAADLDTEVQRVAEAIARAVPHLQEALGLPVHRAPRRPSPKLRRAA